MKLTEGTSDLSHKLVAAAIRENDRSTTFCQLMLNTTAAYRHATDSAINMAYFTNDPRKTNSTERTKKIKTRLRLSSCSSRTAIECNAVDAIISLVIAATHDRVDYTRCS